jgi:signal transduction histidine kinase
MERHFLVISFTDNGKGFDQTAPEPENSWDWKRFRGGNGLINMRKRAEDLGGSYKIESGQGKGTTVTLSIPLEIAE